jgi:hypothetical protein
VGRGREVISHRPKRKLLLGVSVLEYRDGGTLDILSGLSLYGDKGQRRAFIDSSNVTFENSGGKIGGQLGNGMVTLGGENDSFAI